MTKVKKYRIKNQISTTPYDDAFRTLINNCPHMLIPLVNEIFGTNYNNNTPITLLPNEYFFENSNGKYEKRQTDNVFSILDTLFHFEFESTISDKGERKSINKRDNGYDVNIAHRYGKFVDERYDMTYPKSAVIFLRGTNNTSKTLVSRIIDDDKYIEHIIPIVNYPHLLASLVEVRAS